MDTPDEEKLQNDLESHEESQDYNANETLTLGTKFVSLSFTRAHSIVSKRPTLILWLKITFSS